MPSLSVLPLFTALFDWAENIFIWRMVSAPLPVDAWLAETGSLLSLIKHGLLGVSILVLVLLFLRQIYRALVA